VVRPLQSVRIAQFREHFFSALSATLRETREKGKLGGIEKPMAPAQTPLGTPPKTAKNPANQHKLPSMNHLQLKTAPRLFCAGRVLSCLIKPDRVIFLFPSPLIQSVSFAAKFCLELPEISLSSPNIA
jgi:hypothetical protein